MRFCLCVKMTKFRWNDSMKMFRNHVDPEKEEQLKWIAIGNYFSPKQRSFEYDWRLWDGSTFETQRAQFKALPSPTRCYQHHVGLLWYEEHQRLRQMDTKVKRILKLIKSINYGNREANLKKKSEVIVLIEDFHKQYQSLYALYDDLKEGVKKRCNSDEGDGGASSLSSSSSSASLESASYYSPGSESKTPRHDIKETTADGKSEKTESPSSSLEDTTEIVKERLSVGRVSSAYDTEEMEAEEEERSRTTEKLMSEVRFLRERLDERERINQDLESKSSMKIKELEDRVIALNLEIEALNYQKGELEEEFESKEDEVDKRSKENLGLRSRVSELELTFKEKEEEVSIFLKKFEDSEKIFMDKIDEYMDRVQILQREVNSLRSHKDGALGEISPEQVKELEMLRIHRTESEVELEKRTKEVSDSLLMLESIKEKLNKKTAAEEGLIEERDSLKNQVKDLEMAVAIKKEIISQLQEKLKEKEDQISTLEKNMVATEKDMSNEMKSIKQKYMQLEIDFRELETKNDILAATLEEREELISNLTQASKSSFRCAERKMEEMVEEFRKKSEDSIRILGRRIRVAEQLHIENKEWYKRTKDKYEQNQKENELAFQSIKSMIETVSDVLNESETCALRFTECTEHFMNRVSKASCEINFAKDWVRRKNGAITQVKEDVDTLLAQLDDKETEFLASRQKVWKLENRVRELEKMAKENEEGMLVLKEEKREAIRQLCVWIDYHRGRSDFLKKTFSDLLARKKRST